MQCNTRLTSDPLYSQSMEQMKLLVKSKGVRSRLISIKLSTEKFQKLKRMATLSLQAPPLKAPPSNGPSSPEIEKIKQKLKETEDYWLFLEKNKDSNSPERNRNAGKYFNTISNVSELLNRIPPMSAIGIVAPYLKFNDYRLSHDHFSRILLLFPNQAIPAALKLTDHSLRFQMLVHIASEAKPYQKKLALEAISHAEKLLKRVENIAKETLRFVSCALIKWDLDRAEVFTKQITPESARKMMENRIKRCRECLDPTKVYKRLSEPGFSQTSLLDALKIDTRQNPQRAFTYVEKVKDPSSRFVMYFEIAKSRILSLASQQIKPWVKKGPESIVVEYLGLV